MARGDVATNDAQSDAPRRLHKATWSTDKRKGGYLIRVIGPNANRFAGRDVPVTRRDDSESIEHLEALIWTGTDKDTGAPVALYKVTPRPPDSDREEEIF